jgi:hypothetical protein
MLAGSHEQQDFELRGDAISNSVFLDTAYRHVYNGSEIISPRCHVEAADSIQPSL